MLSDARYPNITLSGSALHCQRGGRSVFHDLSFEVTSGDVLFVKGDNGSGKSSLLRIIAGLLAPLRGKLKLQEGTSEPLDFDPKGHLHFVGHLPGLKGVETINETINGWASFYGFIPDIEQTLSPLNLYDLKDTQTKYLSEGQKRRLSLSRVLNTPLPIWLLDEPNSGLDSNSLKALIKMVDNHRKKGGVVIMASHVEAELESMKTLNLNEFKGCVL